MALPLQANWSDQTLDFGGLVALGLSLLLGEGPTNDILTNIILLRRREEEEKMLSPTTMSKK